MNTHARNQPLSLDAPNESPPAEEEPNQDMVISAKRTESLRQLTYEANLHSAAEWLAHTMEVCPVNGSSVAFALYKGWYPAYPETSGYIVPTFFAYGRKYHRDQFVSRARRLVDWLLSLQFDNGAFPGGAYILGKTNPPSVFNSGQIIIGLVSAYQETKEQKYIDAAARAAAWLAREQDDNGAWTRHAYLVGFSPSYYSRVCWPMLMTTTFTNDTFVREAAAKGLQHIAAKQRENGAFEDWAFAPQKPAFTHTIAYTIRGMIEAADLLEDRAGLGQVATKAASKLFRLFEIKKRIAGSYDSDWRGCYWYQCLTGNCQLALCWLRLYDWTNDARFVNAAAKAIDTVTRTQRTSSTTPKAFRGAVAGSAPIYGRYLTLRFPNWAAKFLMDAIMYRDECLIKIESETPTA